ncbi:GNAT family N-acetyltransferase [Carboxylicivirga taeanensis]|uniref:GNAT family N-acetyltransferase n=1 Tax=Carboxylicivirga taeanensis TaxID=1416875 RepID=UPI003F6DFF0F
MNIIVNSNIVLRPLKQADATVIFTTIDQQREYLGQWLPFVTSTQQPRDTEEFIKGVVQQPVEQRELIFTIWFHNEFAGIIGFKDTDSINSKSEIGYWLSEPCQKNGIITQCVRVLCNHAFNKLGLHRLQIKCAVGNLSSQKIPERLGFTFEGIERAGERFDADTYFDLKIYSKLKSDPN